ncbi:glycerate dehydrogenase [Streptomyces mashuensis]|uniref:Glycerate dehydrogenase n=1 Tax=Streptomyces mashuensis TaxID=33904 RepID=A0A919B2V0_9ACTN|nr:hydroxyacid dehydrogenase [Streptomyces mashuensis]GHF45439.1 glycerate dehydrogenase [Streptomyces mashuensis]
MGARDRPTIVVAMGAEEERLVLPPDVRTRLALCGTVATGLGELHRADVLLTGWGCPPLTDELLERAGRLRLVVHAAGSVKWLLPGSGSGSGSWWDRGVTVTTAADANAEPVADFAYGAVLLALKQALGTAAVYASRGGEAGRPGFLERHGADGAVVGVVGASRVGRRLIARLRTGRLRILLHDPYVSVPEAAQRLGAERVGLDELCARSSVVTLHAPELPETRHMLNAGRLALIQDGGTVINTARGSLVDTDALVQECAAGRLAAFLDVTDPEPLPQGHPLLGLPNVLVTPHIAGAQGSEVRRLGVYAVEEIERWVRGLPLRGRVEKYDLGRLA